MLTLVLVKMFVSGLVFVFMKMAREIFLDEEHKSFRFSDFHTDKNV